MPPCASAPPGAHARPRSPMPRRAYAIKKPATASESPATITARPIGTSPGGGGSGVAADTRGARARSATPWDSMIIQPDPPACAAAALGSCRRYQDASTASKTRPCRGHLMLRPEKGSVRAVVLSPRPSRRPRSTRRGNTRQGQEDAGCGRPGESAALKSQSQPQPPSRSPRRLTFCRCWRRQRRRRARPAAARRGEPKTFSARLWRSLQHHFRPARY